MPCLSGKFLLIDNSNSFTKLALASGEALLEAPRRISTRELTRDSLMQALRRWEYERVILSSVVPNKGDLIEEALVNANILRVDSRANIGVAIDYPKPRTIGADRLANAAAAAKLFGAPVVVVDFGTAVSFDIVSGTKGYVGGVLAPGLEAMTDYLNQRTALLPKIALIEPPSAIGKSTKQAMLAGAVYGYRGLVKEILSEIQKELGEKKVRVVATGGYAELIAAKLPEIESVHEHLTLEGLRIIGTLNSR